MSSNKNVRNLTVEEMRKETGGVGLHVALFSERKIPYMKGFVRRIPVRNRSLKGRS